MITDLINAYFAYVFAGSVACLTVVGGWNVFKKAVQ